MALQYKKPTNTHKEIYEINIEYSKKFRYFINCILIKCV